MSNNEIDAHIAGLESQLAELKTILYGATTDSASSTATGANSDELAAKDKEISLLKAENKKLNYRILTLVRSMGEMRDQSVTRK
ncbi:hypothetical protein HDU98_011794 [Podochytrium sp. JEL0797]|nr:hypothetical protein HDU98_011794 [Podochytrium sp. JEL0797]